jgi:plasmid stabilization system protein ParE
MTIRIVDDAEDDLDAGFEFYKQQSGDVAVGSYFLDTLHSEIDSLRLYAGIHPKKLGSFRMLSRRFPFAIFYDIVGDEIQVLRVLDCRRDPIWTREQLE